MKLCVVENGLTWNAKKWAEFKSVMEKTERSFAEKIYKLILEQ